MVRRIPERKREDMRRLYEKIVTEGCPKKCYLSDVEREGKCNTPYLNTRFEVWAVGDGRGEVFKGVKRCNDEQYAFEDVFYSEYPEKVFDKIVGAAVKAEERAKIERETK